MKKAALLSIIFLTMLSAQSQPKIAEDYYVLAFNEMSDMLARRDTLSIKRATYLAEWAYYEGDLDYQTDFCDEINRIVKFIKLFYKVNGLKSYHTGKQMALNEYFFRPYSGNEYKPYSYIDNSSKFNTEWEKQFVSLLLKTHKGQCRSLPWMYKILAEEIDANVSIAMAPRHSYIMYEDKDNFTPEDWINLELTTHQMVASFGIKKDFEIRDSAIMLGTYMTPLTDIQTVACQMSDLAAGYNEKFKRYDEFTFYCTSRSLEFYPMNPRAWYIRGKSLEQMIQNHFKRNGYIIDDHSKYLIQLMDETKQGYDNTYLTIEPEKYRNLEIQEIEKNAKK